MPKITQWERHIGRRLQLRDLFVFFTVVQNRSMAKAAAQLGVSTPAVSEIIADLEHALGVKVFDRSAKGVATTHYGEALLIHARAAFDDLRQAIQAIEHISDPAAGELRIGATEPLIDGLIFEVMSPLVTEHPRIRFNVRPGDTASLLRALRERTLDLVLSRRFASKGNEDLAIEPLFDEQLFVVAGADSPWLRRRRLRLADLIEAPWAMPEPQSPVGTIIADGLRSTGLVLEPRVISNSPAVRIRLVASKGFLTMLTGSMLHFGTKRLPVAIVPMKLPFRPQSVGIVTVKDRTISAVASLFIKHLRTAAKPLEKLSGDKI